MVLHIAAYDVRFLCAEIREGLAALRAGVADVIFADPPYNLGIDYGKGGGADRRRDAEFLSWTSEWITLANQALRPGGAFWLLINERYADQVGTMLSNFVGPRFNRIIWRETFGTYREQCFPSGHRHLFYHVKPPLLGRQPTWNPDAIRVPSQRMLNGDARAGGKRPPEKQGRVPDDVWEISRLCGTFKERVDWHPCQLPSMPLERALLCSSNAGDVIVEPFSGSGSLALVARKLGRRYLGIDENANFIVKAIDRVKMEVSRGCAD